MILISTDLCVRSTKKVTNKTCIHLASNPMPSSGRDCDREVGVIKTNSAYWVECMETELQVLELREKELRVLDRLKEEEYREYVTKTGCKIRSWHMTTLSLKWQIKVEEAQRDRAF